MLYNVCRKCGFKSRILEEYKRHLREITHQNLVRNSFMTWSDTENALSLVVYTPVEVPPPLPSDVIGLFTRLQMDVVDFVCWTGKPRLFIVKVGTREQVDQVMRLCRLKDEALQINGQSIHLRRKAEVSEHEWPMLVGDGTAKEGSANEAVLIEINDDDESRSPDLQPQPQTQENDDSPTTSNDNDENKSASEDDEEIDDVVYKINTKMSQEFIRIFQSKIKEENAADDKKKVKANLKAMREKWTDIYLEFHNRLWPLCFVMGNQCLAVQKVKSVGFESTYICYCLQSDENKWLRKKLNDRMANDQHAFNELVGGKVQEFFKLLKNETKCSRKIKKLKDCSQYAKPLLSFKINIVILHSGSNSNNISAEVTFSEVKGKGSQVKMKAVKAIFERLFKLYEPMKANKWHNAEKEVPLANSDNWQNIVTVE